MASGRTVRQVKQGERLRRSQTSLNPISAPELEKFGQLPSNSTGEFLDAYGPYKPVPPPKPLIHQRQNAACLTAPPYRMPPYPAATNALYADNLSVSINTDQHSVPVTEAKTHCANFAVDRRDSVQQTSSNSIPNRALPSLNNYARHPAAIMTATAISNGDSHQHMHQRQSPSMIRNNATMDEDQYSTHHVHPYTTAGTSQQHYRSTYPDETSMLTNTGGRPVTSWHEIRNYQSTDDPPPTPTKNQQTVTVQIENGNATTSKGTSKTMTKTYHTIKDIFSGKFQHKTANAAIAGPGSGQQREKNIGGTATDNSCSAENNQLRSSMMVVQSDGNTVVESTPAAAGNLDTTVANSNHLNMVPSSSTPHHQYQYTQQQQQYHHHYHQQNAMLYHQALARSQELLSNGTAGTSGAGPHTRAVDQGYYYHTTAPNDTNNHQRNSSARNSIRNLDPNSVQMHHVAAAPIPLERRSAQQLERQRTMAASYPQLSAVYDGGGAITTAVPVEVLDHRPQPQTASRRPSHDDIQIDVDITNGTTTANQLNETLQGTPRKQLEGEIGKIEGVYNVGVNGGGGGSVDNRAPPKGCSSAASSDYDKTGQSPSNVDSGRGSATYSSGRRPTPCIESDTNATITGTPMYKDSAHGSGQETEWVDMVETELRHILEPRLQQMSLHGSCKDPNNAPSITSAAATVISESGHSSTTPPLPTLPPNGDHPSPNDTTPRNSASFPHHQQMNNHMHHVRHGHYQTHQSISLPYGSKPEYERYNNNGGKCLTGPPSSGMLGNSNLKQMHGYGGNASNGGGVKHRTTPKHKAMSRGATNDSTMSSVMRHSKQTHYGLDGTDLTSNTTRSLDLESMLERGTDDEGDDDVVDDESDGELSATDARNIRKQLEGLETMYAEVLKLLGVKRHQMIGVANGGGGCSRYNTGGGGSGVPKRRYGSMSSLPSSSVSSRPVRDKRRSAHEERKKVRDMRGVNKRFQRLEAHVVTLARSVAHLSSEMRTQHVMFQEMDGIRAELGALRAQTNMLSVKAQNARVLSNAARHSGAGGTAGCFGGANDLPSLANPASVKKLTKFFGDEPPLLRLFLKKLGYEKYANVFEHERIGMVELPYLSEERLQKMGVPLGPRLRIMQEAQISVCDDNTLCIV